MRFTSAVSSLLLASAATASPISVEERAIEARALPVGQVISKCTVPGTVALTFDDGPHAFTQKALNLLRDAGMKATFFVNGENFSKITDRKPAIDRIMAEGHQLGSHTYSHVHLPQLSDQQIRDDMMRLENTLVQMKGKFPTYMRPPYFEWDARSLATLGALGYHVIHADIDTLDWQNNTPETFQKSVQNFRTGLDQGGRLTLAHDVHYNTVNYLLPELIKIVKNRGLRAVTVGECLGDPAANWYRGPRTTPPPATGGGNGGGNGPIGPGGACGGAQKYMCASGQCCSQYGYCGTTGEYCGAGCNPLFGRCN